MLKLLPAGPAASPFLGGAIASAGRRPAEWQRGRAAVPVRGGDSRGRRRAGCRYEAPGPYCPALR
jgi:hypothetical protein